MHTLHAIDLSHYQKVSSFAAIRAAVIGVIHKATEGESYTDPTFASRKSQARGAGLLWASYHFLHHGGIATQLRHYLDVAQPGAGERVCIDYEHADCTLADLKAAVAYLHAHAPNNPITIYGGSLLKEHIGGQKIDWLAGTSLWTAEYTTRTAPKWPSATWPKWDLWQYSDGESGGSPKRVAGVDRCDCNTFNGTEDECRAWFGASAAPAVIPSYPTLMRSASGEAVIALQKALTVHGITVLADGWFGPNTELAVKIFQKRVDLTIDGIAGPKTWAALAGSQAR
jgi:lysozyme